MNKTCRHLRQAAGFALLEALVAVVVASVGFVGAARLQTLGLKMNASAQLRQKAVLLSYQMTDRIRANLAGYSAGAYNNPAVGSKACLATGCTEPSARRHCGLGRRRPARQRNLQYAGLHGRAVEVARQAGRGRRAASRWQWPAVAHAERRDDHQPRAPACRRCAGSAATPSRRGATQAE